jgi:N-acetylglucosaminyl-diphospho-decaprenol L-rhamnosyltransferase
MSARGDIAAVVVSHQSASTIGDCVTRLLVCGGVGAVVVVDNASSDGTVEIVRTLLDADPRLLLVTNADNPGFGTACNQGAARTDLPWLALVNPDCLLEPDDLQRLLNHAQSRPDTGLMGATLLDEHGAQDPASHRRDASLERLLAGRGRRGSLWIAPDPALPLQPVEAVSGALMLMPRALFQGLGGFDEGYRLHAEDLDLCRRVRQAGHGVYVANDVRVLHLRGVSSRSRPVWVEWQKHRGLWRYLGKFELGQAAQHRRLLGWLVVWGHFLLAAPLAWRRARAG